MNDFQKYPLVMVDSEGDIRRVYCESITRVRCPYGFTNCTYHCAMFGVYDNGTDLPAIICRSHDVNIPIGLADPETFDLDKLEAIMAGSQLADHLIATGKIEQGNKSKDSE
jgi:hypothetical protein